MERCLILIGSLLLVLTASTSVAETLAPGTAWILYRQSAGGWVPGSATYGSKAACEAAAQELATRLKSYTGCAIGVVRYGGAAGGEYNAGAVRSLDAATAAEAKAAAVEHAAKKAEREAERERNRPIETTCERPTGSIYYPGPLVCTSHRR